MIDPLSARASDQALEFRFIQPGPLIDRELELVQPSAIWIDSVLSACRHPLTRAFDMEHAQTTRAQLERFISLSPCGLESGDPSRGKSPSYHFWMHLRPEFSPAIAIAGAISLRIGRSADLETYFGHIGYNVYPPARGHHYAERACRLLLNLARMHGLSPLWITADPENHASRRTCERLGATLVEIVNVPVDHVLYRRGQRHKCRYRINL